MTEANKTNGESQRAPQPFTIERSLIGVADSYMSIAERVVNGSLGTNEAREATHALNGVPGLIKVQLEAIKIFEKGSEKARAEAASILDLGKPKAIADKSAA